MRLESPAATGEDNHRECRPKLNPHRTPSACLPNLLILMCAVLGLSGRSGSRASYPTNRSDTTFGDRTIRE